MALYCLFIPQLFASLTRIYAAAYHELHPGPGALTAIRFFLALLVILPPTLLMGGSLPALARYVAFHDSETSWRVSRLYAWNTLGASAGVLSATYLMMPWLGIRGTNAAACGTNLLIFGCVAALAFRPEKEFEGATQAPIVASESADSPPVRIRRTLLLLIAFRTGAPALAYEVIWTYVLAFLIGNTVYAFGTMLFAYLCGLAWGARIVSRRARQPDRWGSALAASRFFSPSLSGTACRMYLPWDRGRRSTSTG